MTPKPEAFKGSEIGIEYAADRATQIEATKPFLFSGTINLGTTFSDDQIRRIFSMQPDFTVSLRNFFVSDCYLDVPCMLLFKNSRRIRESRYLLLDSEYETSRIHTESLEKISGADPVILGFNRGKDSYYHWLVQCIPAIDSALRVNVPSPSRIALPRTVLPWQRELLDLLDHAAIQEVYLDHNRHYHFENLIFSEHLAGATAFSWSSTASLAFDHLRKAAVPEESDGNGFLYVARIDSRNRVLTNESTVIRLFEELGFEIVIPGLMSVKDQIKKFSDAKVVVGPHGGGLSNIVFCQRGAFVYELLTEDYPNACFNRLAQLRGLHYWADMFTPLRRERDVHSSRWVIDINFIIKRVIDLLETADNAEPSRNLPQRRLDKIVARQRISDERWRQY